MKTNHKSNMTTFLLKSYHMHFYALISLIYITATITPRRIDIIYLAERAALFSILSLQMEFDKYYTILLVEANLTLMLWYKYCVSEELNIIVVGLIQFLLLLKMIHTAYYYRKYNNIIEEVNNEMIEDIIENNIEDITEIEIEEEV